MREFVPYTIFLVGVPQMPQYYDEGMFFSENQPASRKQSIPDCYGQATVRS
jgi:hypothetical protein